MRAFFVIVMSTGSDNLKEFLIGRSTVRKVIESQEICDRPSNSTEVDSQEICDRLSNSTEGDRLQEICDRSSNSTGRLRREQ